jgi:hypothetical protein
LLYNGKNTVVKVHYVLNSSFGITSEIEGKLLFSAGRAESRIKSCESSLRIVSIYATEK